MAKATSALEQLEQMRLDFVKKSEALKASALEELYEKEKQAQATLQEILAQISELTGKPITPKKGKRSRIAKTDLEALVTQAISFLPSSEKQAISKGDIIEKLGIDTSSWQTISKKLVEKGLKKTGDKKNAKWYMK